MKTVKAIYGKVSLVRSYCPDCESYAFVIDGAMACCGSPVTDGKPEIIKKMTRGNILKRYLNPSAKKIILESQNHKCFYCRCDLVSSWYMGGKMKRPQKVSVHFDHIVPWVFSQNDDVSNFVAACNVCNRIKFDRIFSTIEKLREWVLLKRAKMKYEIL